jgi:hypothetical protein
MSSEYSRRKFLAALGASAALTPFVPLLNAAGQEKTFPKRLLLFFTPHGTVKSAWTPSGSENAFTLSPILKPLERHKAKLVVLSGISMQDVGVGAPHTKGLPLVWTGSRLLDDGTFVRSDGSGGPTYGWNSSPSVDQIVANAIGKQTPYRSLEFGVRSGGSNPASRMVYTDAKQPIAPAIDPWAQFTRLFAGRSDAQTTERLQGIAIARAELSAIASRIGSAERDKIDAHLTALSNIQSRLSSKASLCMGPKLATKADPNAVENTPLVLESQLGLIVAALSCDLTRVASLQYSIGDNDGAAYPWLNISDGHHGLTHAGDSDTASWNKVIQIRTWYSEMFAKLLDQLAAVPEGSGSLLDNTMVVWGSELGIGNTHSFKSTPFVVAGGGGGAYTTGRFLEYADKLDHNRLLVSICSAMGLPNMETFGNTDVGKGPLPGFLK